MTEEIRPICLYVETCLDRKEGTRDCSKCEHHLNYWTEVMIRDMEKNIKRLEQENKELKDNLKSQQMINLKQQEIALDYWNALEEIRSIADDAINGRFATKSDDYTEGMETIGHYVMGKITEVLQ